MNILDFKGDINMIELRKITEGNLEQCLMLRLNDNQKEYIAD